MAVVPMRRPQPAFDIPNLPSGINIQIVDDDELTKPANDDTGPDKQFDRNLATDIDPMALSALAGFLLEGIEADIQSRAEWEDTANLAAEYLGIKLNDPTTSVSADGTITKAISTCMLEGQIKLWSTSRAELLPVGGPVKTRRDDTPASMRERLRQATAMTPPPSPQGGIAGVGGASPPTPDELADALATDMNHYLTVTDKEYYPDFSKMLSNRTLIGNAFRKVYRDPLLRRPRSIWVKAVDLIVSNDCSHLSGAGRVTERIRMRQATMKRMQASGHYLDIALARPTGTATASELAVAEIEGISATQQLPEDFEHQVYECYCEVGSGTASSLAGDLRKLDRDDRGKAPGYPMPYRVSIDVDSRAVLEIRRDWKKGDTDHRRRRRYVKYGFIPSPIGGFYDLGLIHIVGNPTQVATMIGRSTTDNTLFQNFPGWLQLKGPGSRQSNTVIRPNVGEVVTIDAAGAAKIQDVIIPIPYKPTTPEAIGLLTKSESDVRRLAGIIEIPVGEGRVGNTPVGTIMSYIEAIAQVPGAIHKDDHIAQQEEFELLRDLFAEDPAALIAGNRSPARRWEVGQELSDADIVPAADPNTPSQIHRLMKVQARVTMGGLPQFAGIADNRAIWKEGNRVLGGDPDEFTLPEAPPQAAPPDPKVLTAQIKAQADVSKANIQAQQHEKDHQARLLELAEEGRQDQLDRESEETRAALHLQGDRVKTAHSTANAALDRAHDAAGAAADRSQDHVHHLNEQTTARFTAGLTANDSGGEKKE